MPVLMADAGAADDQESIVRDYVGLLDASGSQPNAFHLVELGVLGFVQFHEVDLRAVVELPFPDITFVGGFVDLLHQAHLADDFAELLVRGALQSRQVAPKDAVPCSGADLRLDDSESRLLPLDEPHAPLGDLITALEADVDRLSMSTARNHNRQAVDSVVDGRHEAANSQLRAMFEKVVAHLAAKALSGTPSDI